MKINIEKNLVEFTSETGDRIPPCCGKLMEVPD